MKAAWGVAYKVACGVCLVWLLIVLGVAVHYGWRALVADTFIIPSDSMSPTLLPGDKVRVDKTIFGARLYTSLDFTDGRMESIRTRGRRGLRYNDIVVFNYPVNDKGCIGFKMNYVPRWGDILRMEDWRKAEIYLWAIEWETGACVGMGRGAYGGNAADKT